VSRPRFTGIFALVGVVIPILFRLTWWLIYYFEYRLHDLEFHIAVEKLMLMLWPTSIMLMAERPDAGPVSSVFIISTGANVIVYAAIGFLIWLGLRKHIVYFILAGAAILLLWWRLLTL